MSNIVLSSYAPYSSSHLCINHSHGHESRVNLKRNNSEKI